MSTWAHLRQHDHWTFLVALCLVAANLRLEDRRASALALSFLLAALGYDLYEVVAGREAVARDPPQSAGSGRP